MSSDVLPFRRGPGSTTLPTPDISPISTQSIDERIDAAIGKPPSREAKAAQRERERGRGGGASSSSSSSSSSQRHRDVSSSTTTEADPVSAVSDKSTSGLVGLPSSPRPGVNRFPSLDTLPASPRPTQQSFSGSRGGGGGGLPPPISTTTSAVRQGGALPLRAYEPSLGSPSAASTQTTTKQTVFTRAAGPLSPGMTTGMRTPWTGAPVPYTPYQPFSPVVPITPSLVTRDDRRRIKRMVPKTPTVEMVKGSEDIW